MRTHSKLGYYMSFLWVIRAATLLVFLPREPSSIPLAMFLLCSPYRSHSCISFLLEANGLNKGFLTCAPCLCNPV